MVSHWTKVILIATTLAWPALSSAKQAPQQEMPNSNNSATISLEAGPAFKLFGANDDSKKLITAAIDQQIAPLLFHEVSFGGWVGKDPAAIAAYSFGITLFGLSAHAGPSYISAKNSSLGTYWQILMGIKYAVGPLQVGFKHFSNGRKVFNHSKGPNKGLNFVTLGVTL